jgi:hypothetical protein
MITFDVERAERGERRERDKVCEFYWSAFAQS